MSVVFVALFEDESEEFNESIIDDSSFESDESVELLVC
jgi:hypothetical protein